MSKIKGMMAICLLGAVLSLCGCKEDEQESSLYNEELLAPEQANYNIVQVVSDTYTDSSNGSMSVYYPITAELSWNKADTYIREVLVKKDQEVKKGDTLVVFDTETSTADRTELSLSIARLKEEMVSGKQTRQSAIEAAKQKTSGLSGHELQIALLTVEKLQAEYEQYVFETELQIAQQQERLQKLEKEVKNNTLIAPFDGVIDSVETYYEGDLVDINKAILTMHSSERFYLAVKGTAENLRYNMEVTVSSGRNNGVDIYTGRVVTAGNVTDGAAAQGPVLIEVSGDVSDEDFRSVVKYECVTAEVQNVPLLNSSAVHKEGEKRFVYVLEGDMVQKRYVVPGLDNKEKIWILDGISVGQNVIVN